jgi:hypothetical protein
LEETARRASFIWNGGLINPIVANVSEAHFIDQVVVQLRAGFRLVPFVGSGCSSRSGILMGGQFHGYLAWTTFICVADPRESRRPRRWDLRRNGWPDPPTETDLEAARAWASAKFCALAEACGLEVDDNPARHTVRGVAQSAKATGTPDSLAGLLHAPFIPQFLRDPSVRASSLTDGRNLRQLHELLGDKRGVHHGGLLRTGISPTSEDAIVERAIRSLYDWRSTLRFLSELRLDRDGGALSLVEAEPAVIDGFNVHITQGRRPNLTHTMLAHLRQPARARVVLTTNFDTLIEDAFAQLHRRIEVISVSLKGALPDPEIVHARDTVVKLHGTLSETRADFSLDDPPTPEDLRRFFHYIRGGPPGDAAEGGRFVPGHLLVAGYSGADARCVQLMKFVLDSDRDARIFWVAYTKNDREFLKALFPERAYEGRIVATSSERFDLLLYELYQRLCLSLPPGGFSYQITHNVPPGSSFKLEPDDDGDDGEKIRRVPGAAAVDDRLSQLRAAHNGEHPGQPGDGNILVVAGSSGVLAALRSSFKAQGSRHGLERIWLELEDYPNAAAVAHELFQVIAIRRGLFQLGHAQLCPHDLCESPKPFEPSARSQTVRRYFHDRIAMWRDHFRLLLGHLGTDPRHWVIFLYGRNGPGGCVGWKENVFWNGEAEFGTAAGAGQTGQRRVPGAFAALLRALADVGFTIVYAPYMEERRARDRDRREFLVRFLQDWNAGSPKPSPDMDRIARQVVDGNFPVPADGSIHSREQMDAWLGKEGQRWSWLDLSPELNQFDDEEIRFKNTVRAILHHSLRLDAAARADRTDLTRRQRFNLLYGASLFRQSRQYTAFLSEGVFPCPDRFNAAGRDNDMVRYRSVEQWLRELSGIPRVFHRKSSGLAWAYRDIRLACRCLAEAVSTAVHRHEQGGGAPSRDALLPASGLRARTQFWIGEWYLRAFYVSGHANPLMEAAYHFFQCAYHAVAARNLKFDEGSKLELKYRQFLWRRGVNQLVKVLRLGAASLRFWFGRAQMKRWFGDADVVPELEKSARKLGLTKRGKRGKPDADDQVLSLLTTELEQLQMRAARQRTLRFQHYESLHGMRAAAGDKIPKPPVLDPATPLDRAHPQWSSLLKPGGMIKRLLGITESASGGNLHDIEDTMRRLEVERFMVGPARAANLVQELVQWAFLLLSRAKREEHAVPLEEVPDKVRVLGLRPKIRHQWVRVCVFARAAIDAGHFLPPGLDAFGSYETSKALAMYGVALAHLNRFYEAHRRLNHAHALLCDVGRSAPLVPFGILELRRAEAYAREAELARELADLLRLEMPDRGLFEQESDGEVPETLRRLLESHVRDQARQEAIWAWLQAAVRALRASSSSDPDVPAGLRRIAVARCGDAWGCLEQAERFLGGRTHSRLWWSRLRAVQLQVLATTPTFPEPNSDRRGPFEFRRLRDRIRHDVRARLATLWLEGRAAAPDDHYDRLRVLDYYVQALDANVGLSDGDRRDVQAELDLWKKHARRRGKTDRRESLGAGHRLNVELRAGLRAAPVAAAASPREGPRPTPHGDGDGAPAAPPGESNGVPATGTVNRPARAAARRRRRRRHP